MPDSVLEHIFNPTRLVLARKRRGLTQTQFAKILEVHRRAVCGYESGEYSPSDEALANMSALLRFPIEFFFGDDIDEPTLETGSFRSMSRMAASERDMALSQAAIGVHLSHWLDTMFELPPPALPDLGSEPIPEVAAESLRKAWGIGQLSIRNMVHLLEAKGVRVFSLAIEAQEVDAFSMWKAGVPYVFLNTYKSAEHSRFDAAHELGHLVMHRNAPTGRQAEREADAFASAFLMPAGSIHANSPKFPTLPVILKLKRTWSVSVIALAYRLHSLDLISDWHYRNLCIEITKLGYRETEPDGIPRETSAVLPRLLTHLQSKGISRKGITDILAISTHELDGLLFGLVITSVPGGRLSVPKQSVASLSRIK